MPKATIYNYLLFKYDNIKFYFIGYLKNLLFLVIYLFVVFSNCMQYCVIAFLRKYISNKAI